MSIRIEVNDGEVGSALQSLYDALGKLDPALKEIGDVLVDSTIQRFKTATSPDGTKWEDNAEVTILRYLRFKSGKTSFKTRGGLTKKGQQRYASKRPGTGESGKLQEQIFYNVKDGMLEIGSPLIYAGTFHFGAKKGQYGARVPWGEIPARKFLGLSQADEGDILEIVKGYLPVL